MPDYSEWVSTLALLLGGVSLGWQMLRSRREQPIITVDGQWSVDRRKHHGLWEPPQWSFPVHVTNAGGRAVTVTEVGWELHAPAGPMLVRSTDMGADLPLRLEALSAESWEARMPVHGTKWEGLRARPVARVVLRQGVVPVYGSSAVLSVPDMPVNRIEG